MGNDRWLHEKWDFSNLRPAYKLGVRSESQTPDGRTIGGLNVVAVALILAALALQTNNHAALAMPLAGPVESPFGWVSSARLGAAISMLLFALNFALALNRATMSHWVALIVGGLFALLTSAVRSYFAAWWWLIPLTPAAILILYFLSALLPISQIGWRMWGVLAAGAVAVVGWLMRESTWWFVIGPIASGLLFYLLVSTLIERFPRTESRPGASDLITGIAVTLLVAIALFDMTAPQSMRETLSNSIGGAEKILNSLQFFSGALAATALVGALEELIRTYVERLTPPEREERRRLWGNVRVHRDLRSVKCRVVLLGSAELEALTQACQNSLLEIWLQRDKKYRFHATELVTLIDTYFPDFTSEEYRHDLVVTIGNSRQVLAYDTIQRFYERLTDPEASDLISAFEDQRADVIRNELDSETILSSERNLDAIRQMARSRKGRLLVVDSRQRYIGFCERNELVAQIYG